MLLPCGVEEKDCPKDYLICDKVYYDENGHNCIIQLPCQHDCIYERMTCVGCPALLEQDLKS